MPFYDIRLLTLISIPNQKQIRKPDQSKSNSDVLIWKELTSSNLDWSRVFSLLISSSCPSLLQPQWPWKILLWFQWPFL